MRSSTTHISVVLGLFVLPLLLACAEPTRPGLPDADAPTGAPQASSELSAEILGPTSIGATERCSWAARLSGVRAHYSIEWRRRDPGDETWRVVETMPVYGGGLHGSRSFQLRLDVTDATGSASDQISVRAGGSSGCVDGSERGE